MAWEWGELWVNPTENVDEKYARIENPPPQTQTMQTRAAGLLINFENIMKTFNKSKLNCF